MFSDSRQMTQLYRWLVNGKIRNANNTCIPKVHIVFPGPNVCRQIPATHIYLTFISLWILSEWRFAVVTTSYQLSTDAKHFDLVLLPEYIENICLQIVCSFAEPHMNTAFPSQSFAFFAEYCVLWQALLCLRTQWCGTSRKCCSTCMVYVLRRVFFSLHVFLFNVAYSHKYFHRTAAFWVCFSDSNHNVFSNSRCTKHQVERTWMLRRGRHVCVSCVADCWIAPLP